jgi:hypothetical protein
LFHLLNFYQDKIFSNRNKLNSDKGVKVSDTTGDEQSEKARYKNKTPVSVNSELSNTFAAN